MLHGSAAFGVAPDHRRGTDPSRSRPAFRCWTSEELKRNTKRITYKAKNAGNIAKHGIDFATASRIFDGVPVSAPGDRVDYGEARMIGIGLLDRIAVLVVVHTDRAGVCRIISARQANRKERERYDQAIR